MFKHATSALRATRLGLLATVCAVGATTAARADTATFQLGAPGVSAARVGPGTTDPSNHQLVRTSKNVLYVVIPDGDRYPRTSTAKLQVYRANQPGAPTGFTPQDAAHAPDGEVNSSASAIGARDALYSVWINRRGEARVGTFDTTANKWGAIALLENTNWTDFNQGDEGAAIAVNRQGVPSCAWTVRESNSQLRVHFATGRPGHMSAPVTVDADTTINAWHPTLAFAPNGDLLLAWIDGVGNYSTDGVVRTRVRLASGTWSATSTIPDTAVAGLDNGPSTLISANGVRHITFCDKTNAIRYWYDAGAGWRVDQQPFRQITHDPVLYPDGAGGLFIIGHATPDDNFRGVGDGKFRFHRAAGAASWGAYDAVATGPIEDATSTRWSQFFFTSPKTVDFSFWTHTPGDGASGYIVYIATQTAAAPTPTPKPTPTSAPTPTPTASPKLLLGDQKVEAFADSNPAGSAEAFGATAVASGQLSTVRVYIGAGSSATQLQVGIYSDAAGHPGALLTSGTTRLVTASAWLDVPVPPATVTAGVRYWIALLAPLGAGEVHFRDTETGAPSEASAASNLAAIPTSWVSGAAYGNAPVSVYGVGK